MASFDIVCEIDTQEVSNAVDQARSTRLIRPEGKLKTVMISKVQVVKLILIKPNLY